MFNFTSEIYSQIKTTDNDSLKFNLEETFFKQSQLYYSYSMELLADEEKVVNIGDIAFISGLTIKGDAPIDLNFNGTGYSGVERNSCFIFFDDSPITSLKVKAGSSAPASLNITLVGSSTQP